MVVHIPYLMPTVPIYIKMAHSQQKKREKSARDSNNGELFTQSIFALDPECCSVKMGRESKKIVRG